MPPLIDLKGKKFGRLTVLCRDEEKNNRQVYWICLCDCGKTKSIQGNKLKNGNTISCGCYHNEIVKTTFLKSNTYEIIDDYCLVEDNKGDTFKIDLDEISILEDNYWRVTKLGYVIDRNGNMIHRVIMSTPEHLEVDHINHDGTDNRKANLRNVTHTENCWNFKANKKNTSTGHKGVNQLKNGKYRVTIYSDGNRKHIGVFEKIEDAISARIKAEKEIRDFITSDWRDFY